jgi:tetratricopeptide (TPR) repeat protein
MIAGKAGLVLAAALLAGCAGTIPVRVDRSAGDTREPSPAATADTQDIFRGIPAKYRKLADSAERSGNLRRALLYRKVVDGFAPEDAGAGEHVKRLERKIRDLADRHYRAALALEERGESAKALREFLAVLVLDPDHPAALRRIKSGKNGTNGKNGEAEAEPRTWTVREGDTMRKIAGEVYRDPDKEFLVAYFNRLPIGSPLPVGTDLLLPDVDTRSSTAPEKIPGYSHPDKEGNGVRNATERNKEGNGVRNGSEPKEGDERKLREAEAHYSAGMRLFLAEDLDGAIREWEKTLSLDPAHPNARRDIDKARRLKGKIESRK